MNIGSTHAEDTCLTNHSGHAVASKLEAAPSFDPSPGNHEDVSTFPEGGLRAWSVVLGSFCAMLSVFGMINTSGVFQQYLITHQLREYSPGQIGWIFSLCLFLTFFGGAFIGPIFDAHGPRLLVLCGSLLLGSSMLLIGLCTEYWHFIMAYSVLSGLGGALVNTPALASIGHFFHARRGNATGIAMASGGLGGIIFPLMLQKLFVTVGFAWATRIAGFIILALLVLANILIRSRLPHKKHSGPILDFRIFQDSKLTLITMAVFLLEIGLFIPLAYISSYGVAHNDTPEFGSKVLALLNGGSVVGRLVAGWASDRFGRFNTLTITISLCAITILGLWLPAKSSQGLLWAFAFLFGVASGSNLSLSPVCVGQLCKTEHYGRYYATSYMVVSFGTLIGVPIAGQILTANHGNYWGLIVFAGLCYASALVCVIISRCLATGWRVKAIY